MDTHKARKAVKVGRLARSEELDASNHDAAISQGATAGRLAAEAGLTLGELDVQVGSFCGAAGAWGAAVDAWYDAQPRDVTATEYASLGSAYCALSSEALGIVERMWAELQRHRSV